MQRRRTLRSHSSLRWGSDYGYSRRTDANVIESMLNPLVEAIPDDRYRRGARKSFAATSTTCCRRSAWCVSACGLAARWQSSLEIPCTVSSRATTSLRRILLLARLAELEVSLFALSRLAATPTASVQISLSARKCGSREEGVVMPIDEEFTDAMHLRPSARLQTFLGKELIADPNLAILEFVKNSYDAGADHVGSRFRSLQRQPG